MCLFCMDACVIFFPIAIIHEYFLKEYLCTCSIYPKHIETQSNKITIFIAIHVLIGEKERTQPAKIKKFGS